MKWSKGYIWIGLAVLLLAALACNFGGGASPTPEVTDVALTTATVSIPATVDSQNGQNTPEVGTPPPATPTEAPAVEGEGGCELRAAYVADVTVPDDTLIEPGESFVKTWRIRNSGSCAWEEGTLLVYANGETIGGPASVSVSPTAPNTPVDISVEMTAPDEPGTYRSNWQLQTPEGTRFGGIFYVQIVVPGEEDDITPTPTVTATPDDGRTPPTDFSGTVSADCSEVDLTWTGATGEAGYRLEGPGGLNLELPADTESYTWEAPPNGNLSVTLVALASDGTEIGRVTTTVNVSCNGEDLPDLVVESISFDPETPVAYLPLEVTVRVRNQGSGDSGDFELSWWGGKNFASPSCTWDVGVGLSAGSAVDLKCDTYKFSSPYSGLESRAAVDPNEAIDEADEGNNVLSRNINVVNPTVVYDFVEKAPQASWNAGPPNTSLSWNGAESDTRGFARWVTSGKNESGGTIQGKCLETHPRWVADGWIQGTYTDLYNSGYTVQEGDRFRASVGFLQNASAGKVTFRVMLRMSDSGNQWIATVTDGYGDGLKVIEADLSPYAGQRADVILEVRAGSDADQDWACWYNAVIYRYP